MKQQLGRQSFSRLWDWMKETRTNQKQLARRMNVDPSLVCHWLTGGRVPSLYNAMKLSELTGIPMQLLIERRRARKLALRASSEQSFKAEAENAPETL